jgi:E3 ubiquitin-protein ligase MYCBP2
LKYIITDFVAKIANVFAFQVCKEEEEAIKVDVHEGCGRVKLFWILALSDARNLKSLVEFRHGVTTAVSSVYVTAATNESGNYHGSLIGGVGASSSCRYCSSAISSSSASLFDDQTINVCSEPDCVVRPYIFLVFYSFE